MNIGPYFMREDRHLMSELCLQDTFKGKTIVLAGASGFLGKVWLSMLLHDFPEVRKVFVLLRRKGQRTAKERFELMVNTVPVFAPLHEKHGNELSAFLSQKIEVLEGDIAEENLGLSSEDRIRVQKEIDLFVNSAGLVDFNPDLRFSLSANVLGTLNVLEFIRGCDHAALQHVSTAYVSGVRKGRITEEIQTDVSPRGLPFNGENEFKDVMAMTAQIEKEHQSPEMNAKVEAELEAKKKGKGATKGSTFKKREQMIRKRWLKEAMIAEGKRRVAKWGYNDIYTYTKALAEALLVGRGADLTYSIFRPAIIETAVSFPFPGWNEGFNTSGPLTYLSGTWFRYLPTRKEQPLDIVPVDIVCRAMTVVGAALLKREQERVYHCGTSDRQPITMARVCELTQLSHRTHLRQHGTNWLERVVLSRWDVIPSPVTNPLAVRRLKNVVSWAGKKLEIFSPKSKFFLFRWFATWSGKLVRIGRRIDQVEGVLELFYPYILHVHRIFDTRALVNVNLKEEHYRFAPEEIPWRKYWLNIHMPGLRRWCYPVIEGKPRELYEPKYPVKMFSRPTENMAGPSLPGSKDMESQPQEATP